MFVSPFPSVLEARKAKALGELTEERRERHGDDDGGGEKIAEAVGEEVEIARELEDDEGELAAASEQQRDADRLGASQSKRAGAQRKEQP